MFEAHETIPGFPEAVACCNAVANFAGCRRNPYTGSDMQHGLMRTGICAFEDIIKLTYTGTRQEDDITAIVERKIPHVNYNCTSMAHTQNLCYQACAKLTTSR